MSSQDDPWLIGARHTSRKRDVGGHDDVPLVLHAQRNGLSLISCSGEADSPLILSSTSEPAWFHDAATPLLQPTSTPFFRGVSEFAFDSWLTIGAEDNTAAVDIISLDDPTYAAFEAFEAGESIEVTGSIGSVRFVLLTPTNVEAIAGSDLKILVAQLTTSGTISGQIQIQLFLENSDNEFRAVLPILPSETCEIDEDGDGLCDVLDPCVGEVDECGVGMEPDRRG